MENQYDNDMSMSKSIDENIILCGVKSVTSPIILVCRVFVRFCARLLLL